MRGRLASYVPLAMPVGITKFGVSILEGAAKLIGVKPFASTVQLDYLTKGWEPSAAKAIRELSWKPLALVDGIDRYLSTENVQCPAAVCGMSIELPCCECSPVNGPTECPNVRGGLAPFLFDAALPIAEHPRIQRHFQASKKHHAASRVFPWKRVFIENSRGAVIN